MALTADPAEIVFGGLLPHRLQETLCSGILAKSLREDFMVEPPVISVSDLNTMMHRAARGQLAAFAKLLRLPPRRYRAPDRWERFHGLVRYRAN